MAYFLISENYVDAEDKTYYAVFNTSTLLSQWFCREDLIAFAEKVGVVGVNDDIFNLSPAEKVADYAMASAKLSGARWLAKETGIYWLASNGTVLKADFHIGAGTSCQPYNIIFPKGVQVTNHDFHNGLLINMLYIPDSMLMIRDSFFVGAHFLNDVVFPCRSDMLTVYIADNAFLRATFDKAVKFSGGTSYDFGDQSFSCSNIIELDCQPANIGVSAFHGCNFLHSIKLSIDSVSTVGVYDYAFSACTALQELDIHILSDLSLGDYVFQDCTSLKTIRLQVDGGRYSIGNYCFYGCKSISEVTLTVGLEKIKEGVFFGCTSLKKIRLDFLTSQGIFINEFLTGLNKQYEIGCHSEFEPAILDTSFSLFAFVGLSRKCKFTISSAVDSVIRNKVEVFLRCLLEEYDKHDLFYEDLLQIYYKENGYGSKPDVGILHSILLEQISVWLEEISSGDYEWSFADCFDLDKYLD